MGLEKKLIKPLIPLVLKPSGSFLYKNSAIIVTKLLGFDKISKPFVKLSKTLKPFFNNVSVYLVI